MTQPDLFTTDPIIASAVRSTAVISPCGLYRYRLTRTWDADKRSACWIMLNPSTADAHIDDPTIRRVMAFSRSWGCGGCVVVNLFGFRATDPSDLQNAIDPVGPDNDQHIIAAIDGCFPIVAAWGAGGAYRGRDWEVMGILDRFRARMRCGANGGSPISCLKRTKSGQPGHPLYIRADAKLTPYELEESES